MSNFDGDFSELACVVEKKRKRREGPSESGVKRQKATCVAHPGLLYLVPIALSTQPQYGFYLRFWWRRR
jgi:hypothetical protein